MSDKTTENEENKKEEKEADQTSKYESDRRYKETYSRTHDHKAAVREYCGGNVWAQENARAVGNWK